MHTCRLIGCFAALLLAAAEVSADETSTSAGSVADSDLPKTIACAQKSDKSLGQCSYKIERDETGRTTVTVIFANSFKRKLFFEDGRFLKANVTMSGVGTDTDWALKDGMHIIRVDRQRYEVPHVLIAGN